MVGSCVGDKEGTIVGIGVVGPSVGNRVGSIVGSIVGDKEGTIVGLAVVESTLPSGVKIMSYITMTERLTSAISKTSPEETSNSVVLRSIVFMLSISTPLTRMTT